MLKNFFKTTFRNLGKNRVMSGINLIGLSVSMTAAVLVLLWVRNERSFDGYHRDAKNIYRITSHVRIMKDESWTWESAPAQLSEFAQKEIPGVTGIARLRSRTYDAPVFNVNGQLFKEKNSAYVDKQWFDLFHYEFLEGNTTSFFSSPYSLLLTAAAAKKYFGNREAVGQVIVIDSVNFQVKAVVKDNPSNSSFQYDVLMPREARLATPAGRKNDQSWGNFNYITFLQLSPHSNPAAVEKQLDQILITNKKDSNVTATLLPLTAMHFDNSLQSSSLQHGNAKAVYVFEVLAALLLIIACINYVNLTTARASLRAKEVSIKKIVGAGKGQLFAQFLAETIIVCLLALCLTIALLYITLPFFNRLTEKQFTLPINSVELWRILALTLLAAVLLNGIYPALLLSRFKPINIFRGINVLQVKDGLLRKGLVVVQFIISFSLIAGAIVIYNQLKYIQEKNPGYDRAQVFQFTIPYSFYKAHPAVNRHLMETSIKQTLLAETSVKQVSSINGSVVDLHSQHSGSLDWDGRAPDYAPSVFQLSADANLPSLLNMKMAGGRWFRPGSTADEHNFILNETAARQFKIHQPVIGQRFTMHGDTGQVIGIIKDFHFASMHEKIAPLVVYNDGDSYRGSFYVKTAEGKIPQAIQAARRVWRQFIPDQPFEYLFLDEQFDQLYKTEQRTSTMMAVFAGIAILISCLGLLGLVVFTAERRIKEIGIRKVLGATLGNILVLLSKDFVRLILIAILIATPFAWWAMNKWLEDFAYRIHINGWIFMTAGFFAILIALVTISFQAFKSAVTNPVESLRTE